MAIATRQPNPEEIAALSKMAGQPELGLAEAVSVVQNTPGVELQLRLRDGITKAQLNTALRAAGLDTKTTEVTK
jgi:hypothetical protein